MNLFELYAVLSLDNQSYKNSLNESKSLTETVGNKIQSVLGKLVSIEVIEKAGTALVNLTKTAVENYGEYEQLVGGMKTLFKANSDQMIQYANEAYKTAQISANDYMDTVTSFSASLISSLDGDTAKSAEYANNAIIDMADNANKMGTSMESIQNAYQGFAKQNYTMLDNLKLGYGGTKEEMERLLEDASKISGIEYDISSFADITSAIHVIQTELGITGTSAEEATTTIQGSFNMMKSAWTNLSTAMADPSQSISEALNQVITSAMSFASNVVPVIGSAVPAVVDGISTLASTLMAELPSLVSELLPTIMISISTLIGNIISGIPSLISSLTEIIPILVSTLADIMTSLAESLPEQLPILIEQILAALQNLADTLAENAEIIINAGIQLFLGLAEGLTQALPTIIEMLPTIITTIADIINDNMPTILTAGIQILLMLVQGIIQSIPVIVENIPQIIEAIVSVISAFNWLNLGKNIIELFGKGIKGMAGFAKSAGTEIWNAIVNVLQELPSKLLSIGKGGISGLINGIKGMLSSLLETAGLLMLDAVQTFSKFSLNDVGKNLIRGLIDGIGNMAGALLKSVGDLMGKVTDKVKSIFGIHSPSKVFAGIGKYLVEGFNNGLDTLDVDQATSGFNDVISNIDRLSSSSASLGRSGGLTQVININREISTADEMARAIRLESKYGLMRGVAIG